MNSFDEPALLVPKRAIFSQRADIHISPGSVLLFGVLEQRSDIDDDWHGLFGKKNTYKVLSGSDLQTVIIPKFRDECISLRNQSALYEFTRKLNAATIYLDITGLPHHIWMPLAKVCIDAKIETNCIYVEPKSYTYNPRPRPGEFFDLSERIRGFFPIPSFAHLSAKRAEEITLVPLLGFEGIRFRHLIERIEPSERDIAPVVGVPGFELEYPFYTFEGNASVLSDTRAWQRVSFVDASCPFALFTHLAALKQRMKGRHLQVATIGTKPHALGAMMYAMKNQDIELLYDHPIRKKERSEGISKCHLYRVSAFMDQV